MQVVDAVAAADGCRVVPAAPFPAGLQEERMWVDSVGQGMAAALEVIFQV